MDENDVNRPPESSQADVTLITRGITVTACVDVSTDHALVVSPQGDGSAWKAAVDHGDKVEVFWVAGNEERTLPAKIVEVDAGEEPRWHLAPTGPAERSQRRKAVRARLAVPVVLPWLDSQLTGTTVDLSEAGMRAQVDGWGLPPEKGSMLEVTIDLGKGFVDLRGELVWIVTTRGPQWLLAMRFDDVSERDGDRLRQRVFEALRAERAHAAG
jgi:c-di-GMP-binding flagellar brake protein YcgR